MKELFKHGGMQALFQFLFCTVMCSALLGVLITSGALLLFANEGRNKTFLIPLVLLFAFFVYAYFENKKTCHQKGFTTFGDKMWGMVVFMLVSLVFSLLFMLYVFIPWWIPNYQGGKLLP